MRNSPVVDSLGDFSAQLQLFKPGKVSIQGFSLSLSLEYDRKS